MQDLFELTRRLVDVPSVTGAEAEVAGLISATLTERGFTVGRQPVEGDRHNVYAVSGPSAEVVLCTHMDTVAPHIPSSEDAEWVYGRGACDAKGIAAAMITAATRLEAAGVRGFALLFVVGEETTSDGARRSEELGWPARAVVVGEPTGNVLASGHKGYLAVDLVARGRSAHSGYPELGDSAIDRLTDALVALRAADWGESQELGVGTVNVGTIEGGVAGNVVAPEATATVSVRVVDSVSAAESTLLRILEDHPRVEAVIRGASEPIQCSTLSGWSVRPVAFGTDLPHLGHLGERFLIGPGSIHDAHTDGERVNKAELVAAVELYVVLVRELLDERSGGRADGA